MPKHQVPTITPRNLKTWKDWLHKNHKTHTKVHLIRYKKTSATPCQLPNKDGMLAAISYGFIDTTVKRLDDERYRQTFVRRNENSRWSANTIRYAEELIEKGEMSEFGLEKYQEGKKKTLLPEFPKNVAVPDMLKEALEKEEGAWDNFCNFAPSYRRSYIVQVLKAKRQETKEKRVKYVVEKAKRNEKK